MPAFFLLIRIQKVMIPLPWFIFWLLMLPLVPVALVASPFFRRKEYGNILKSAHLAWWAMVCLHGLSVDVNSKSGDRVYLSFV
ncbi:MAG: hypothetical protein KAH31_08165 [Candidatus Sabulitectum sp.]|nr:hypothetical protein [Candidatus Sabulitectum sp.]